MQLQLTNNIHIAVTRKNKYKVIGSTTHKQDSQFTELKANSAMRQCFLPDKDLKEFSTMTLKLSFVGIANDLNRCCQQPFSFPCFRFGSTRV
jgi:hypothetical protein